MPSAPAVYPGSNFGHYRILEPLGRGGMATVYRAYEAALDRYIALKVLPAESLADPTFTGRFRREAKVIAALEHPYIVPIYAYGIDEGVPWMAMRLLTGGALSGRLRDGPFVLGRAAEVLADVAAALDFAHHRGVLHRDVKPQNVLLDDEGRAYLADFGVARMLEGTAAVTRSGVVTGTPLYMSPEQARGERVDHRTDIYALGIVAYEMLTGRVPFSADTPIAVLMKHVMDPLPLPPASQVPEPALRAILKCVAKDPAERWATAGRFTDALQAAAGASTPSSRVTPASAQPTLTQFRRSPRGSRSGFAFAVCVVCVGALLYFGLEPKGPQPMRPEVIASPSATPQPSASPSGIPRGVPSSSPSAASISAAPLSEAPQPRTSRTAAPPSAAVRPAPGAPSTPRVSAENAVELDRPDPGKSSPIGTESAVPPPSLTPPPTPTPGPVTDGVAFLVGRWSGRVRQKKNPFIRRELDRPVSTECKRLHEPSRVFCRNDWGIIEDWVVMRHDLDSNLYWYEDSDGLRASASPGDQKVVYQGSRAFQGRTVSWRLTCLLQGPDAFAFEMQWSRDPSSWHTIYDASFKRSP